MEASREETNTTNGVSEHATTEEHTLVDFSSPQKMTESPSTPDSASSARRITRSQTTGRPTIRWGKYGKEDDDDAALKGPVNLKRSFDARAVDDDTDIEGGEDASYMPSKVLKMEPTLLLSASSPASIIDEAEQPMSQTRTAPSRASPTSGEYTFLDASSSSFTSERRGPRIRTAPPVPVPNLTKKSRGRRVPTTDDTVVEGETDGKKSRVYVCKVEDCGKCFSRGEHLKRHIRSIHTHEKPFKCPHPSCDKRFNRNDNLLQHLRVHKGDSSSQTSVDSNAAASAEQSAPAQSSSVPVISERASSRTTARRAARLVRKTKSAASTPPIPAARLAAARVSERSLPVPLPRTYSLPPLPSLTPSYHSPTVAGFMNNTNIAVSSLRTAIDESDGELSTEETDAEARAGHDIRRTLFSFARGLPKDSVRGGPPYPIRDFDRPDLRSGEATNVCQQHDQVLNEGSASAKPHSASSSYLGASASRGTTEEAGDRSTIVSSVPSPLPSAVSP